MRNPADRVHVVVRTVSDGVRPAEVLERIGRHGGAIVGDVADTLTVAFDHVPDAVAFAGSLVDDTAESPRAVAVGIGGLGDATGIAESARPGQVLAAPSIESRSRGRLSCGLSFNRMAAIDTRVFGLVVPGPDERFHDVE